MGGRERRDRDADREEKVGIHNTSSVIHPLPLKAFVKVSYFRGSNSTLSHNYIYQQFVNHSPSFSACVVTLPPYFHCARSVAVLWTECLLNRPAKVSVCAEITHGELCLVHYTE